jgi:hypothetical protein
MFTEENEPKFDWFGICSTCPLLYPGECPACDIKMYHDIVEKFFAIEEETPCSNLTATT